MLGNHKHRQDVGIDNSSAEYSRFRATQKELSEHLDKVKATICQASDPAAPFDEELLAHIDSLVHKGNEKSLALQEAAHYVSANSQSAHVARGGEPSMSKDLAVHDWVDEQVRSLNERWATHQLSLCQLKAKCLKARQYNDLAAAIEKFAKDLSSLERQALRLEVQWRHIIDSIKNKSPSWTSEDSNDNRSLITPDSRTSSQRNTESLRQKLLVSDRKSYEKEERSILQVEKASKSMETRWRLLERRVGIFCESSSEMIYGQGDNTTVYVHPVTKAKFAPPSQAATQNMELQMKMRDTKQMFRRIPPILASLKSKARIQHTLTRFDTIISEINSYITSMRGRAHQTMQRARRLLSIKTGPSGRRSPRFEEQAVEWQQRMIKKIDQSNEDVLMLFEKLTKYLISRDNLPVLEKLSEKSSLAKRSWAESKDLARDAMWQLEAAIENSRLEAKRAAEAEAKRTGNDIIDRAVSASYSGRGSDEAGEEGADLPVSGNQMSSLPPLTEEDSAPSSPLSPRPMPHPESMTPSHLSTRLRQDSIVRPRNGSHSLGAAAAAAPQHRLRRPVSHVSFIATPNLTPSVSSLHRPSLGELSQQRNSMLVPPTQSGLLGSGSNVGTPASIHQTRTLARYRSFVRSPPPTASSLQTPNAFTITLSSNSSRQRFGSFDASPHSGVLAHRNSALDPPANRQSAIPSPSAMSPRNSIDSSRPMLNRMSSTGFDSEQRSNKIQSMLHRPTQLRGRIGSIGQATPSPQLHSRASISDFSPRTPTFPRNSSLAYQPTTVTPATSDNVEAQQQTQPAGSLSRVGSFSRDSLESNSSASDNGGLSQIWSSPSFNAAAIKPTHGLHKKISVVALSESFNRIVSQKQQGHHPEYSLDDGGDLAQEEMPDLSNIFEWHFTVRGPNNSPYEGGKYHGRILLPHDYPYKPPDIIMLTPNGRFELNKKICLSNTSHHPESWQPAWGIQTVLVALISFFPTKGEGAIGDLEYTKQERERLAKLSRSWSCQSCGLNHKDVLNDTTGSQSMLSSKSAESQETHTGSGIPKQGLRFRFKDTASESGNSDEKGSALNKAASSESGSQNQQEYISAACPMSNHRIRSRHAQPSNDGNSNMVSAHSSQSQPTANRGSAHTLPESEISGDTHEQQNQQTVDNKQLDRIICGLLAIIMFLILRRVP
ncbi:hypothetical protein H4219_000048 [Mycoemilia scoparia]|uniref:UBC core domain-containing protein n=1 Tax=Mycoemilia scoparia TaxID=417184 RepID=A0A9W8A6M5_9FUNG|nr:hypothetical protein H4219_000048 [Mycoemilia scoparia]